MTLTLKWLSIATVLFTVSLLFSCKKEGARPIANTCKISKIVADSGDTAYIAYDAEGRVVKVSYPNDPEASHSVRYSAGQRIEESDLVNTSSYFKRVTTYDASGKVINVKQYTNPSIVSEEFLPNWNGNELITDTIRTTSGPDQIVHYTWLNGNITEAEVGGFVQAYSYDLTKPSMAGDETWLLEKVEAYGINPKVRNLSIGSVTYQFDADGKIIHSESGGLGSVDYLYECN